MALNYVGPLIHGLFFSINVLTLLPDPWLVESAGVDAKGLTVSYVWSFHPRGLEPFTHCVWVHHPCLFTLRMGIWFVSRFWVF